LKFNPVSVALSLLDNSSLGRNEDDFNEMLDSLNKAMDIIVNGIIYIYILLFYCIKIFFLCL